MKSDKLETFLYNGMRQLTVYSGTSAKNSKAAAERALETLVLGKGSAVVVIFQNGIFNHKWIVTAGLVQRVGIKAKAS